MRIQALVLVALLLSALLWIIAAQPRLSALLILVAVFAFGAATRCRGKEKGGC